MSAKNTKVKIEIQKDEKMSLLCYRLKRFLKRNKDFYHVKNSYIRLRKGQMYIIYMILLET